MFQPLWLILVDSRQFSTNFLEILQARISFWRPHTENFTKKLNHSTPVRWIRRRCSQDTGFEIRLSMIPPPCRDFICIRSHCSGKYTLHTGWIPLGHRGSPQHWIFTSGQWRTILFHCNLNTRVGSSPQAPAWQVVGVTTTPWSPLWKRS